MSPSNISIPRQRLPFSKITEWHKVLHCLQMDIPQLCKEVSVILERIKSPAGHRNSREEGRTMQNILRRREARFVQNLRREGLLRHTNAFRWKKKKKNAEMGRNQLYCLFSEMLQLSEDSSMCVLFLFIFFFCFCLRWFQENRWWSTDWSRLEVGNENVFYICLYFPNERYL